MSTVAVLLVQLKVNEPVTAPEYDTLIFPCASVHVMVEEVPAPIEASDKAPSQETVNDPVVSFDTVTSRTVASCRV